MEVLDVIQAYWGFFIVVINALVAGFVWYKTTRKKINEKSRAIELDSMQKYVNVIKGLHSDLIATDSDKTKAITDFNLAQVEINKLTAFKNDALANCQNIESCITRIKQRHD